VTPVAVLVGPPGAGQTTVGRLLAAHLDVPFADTDAAVEAKAGKPVAEIFYDDGEPAFRALEAAAVADALTTHPGILALGGGAVLDPATQADLAGVPVVYLEVGLSDAVKRVGLASARPLLVLNPRSQFRKLMEERRPIYERLATVKVTTDERDPADVVDEIVKGLAS
jgi:shikimate kinase